jgi:hypothetical protein
VIAPHGVYPNREAAAFGLRSFLGALPLLVFVFVLCFILFWLAITNPESPIFAIFVVVLTIAWAVVLAWAIRRLRQQTPGSIEITDDGVVARWTNRAQTIPFDHMHTVDPAGWKQPRGFGQKGLPSYVPAAVQYWVGEGAAALELPGSGFTPDPIYLTDENAERVRAALSAWQATHES